MRATDIPDCGRGEGARARKRPTMAAPWRERAVTLAAGAATGALAAALLLRRRERAAGDEGEGGLACEPCEPLEPYEPVPMSPVTKSKDPFSSAKRSGALSWDDYFMSLAFLSAQRSKDPNKQVGACIVSDKNIIISIGYNGFPRGISDDALPWAKLSKNNDPLETKYMFVCHAEANAILNANTDKMGGQRLYVTMFPCNECAKMIIQAGIKEIVYSEAKESGKRADWACYEASRLLLGLAGVRTRQHRLRARVVVGCAEGAAAAADEAAGATERKGLVEPTPAQIAGGA